MFHKYVSSYLAIYKYLLICTFVYVLSPHYATHNTILAVHSALEDLPIIWKLVFIHAEMTVALFGRKVHTINPSKICMLDFVRGAELLYLPMKTIPDGLKYSSPQFAAGIFTRDNWCWAP